MDTLTYDETGAEKLHVGLDVYSDTYFAICRDRHGAFWVVDELDSRDRLGPFASLDDAHARETRRYRRTALASLIRKRDAAAVPAGV